MLLFERCGCFSDRVSFVRLGHRRAGKGVARETGVPEATWVKIGGRAAAHGSVGGVTTVRRVSITLPKAQDICAEPTMIDDPNT
jgi:hypothetical protein